MKITTLGFLAMLLISPTAYGQIYTIIDGKPAAIYSEPCTNGQAYSPSPGVKVFPSPLTQANCANQSTNQSNPQVESSPVTPAYVPPPLMPYYYLTRPITPAEGLGYGLGYILGR